MHENLTVTDAVYGILSDEDVKGRIIGLNKNSEAQEKNQVRELISLNKKLLEKLARLQD